jgi:pre-mRNA-processing factor SLU7
MHGQKFKLDSETHIAVRNLQIREDTAKYLRNLDSNSAYYDPKTRSMRESPYGDANASTVVHAGNNYLRNSGDVDAMRALQMFAWQAEDRGAALSLAANPS